MRAADLIARHADAWRTATVHPFLDGVRDGSLSRDAFDRWLAQDHLFVGALVRAQAGILAGAPQADMAVLAGGVVALVDELAWFEAIADRRALHLDAMPLSAGREYAAFLLSLPSSPYAVAAVSLWAVERAYLEAWETARPGHDDYKEFVEHWTVPAFKSYVEELERAADRALAEAVPADRDAAVEAFLTVARHEAAFWQMAFAGQ